MKREIAKQITLRLTAEEYAHVRQLSTKDGTCGSKTHHERLFREEAANSILRDYAKTSAHEYFADCFVYWLNHSGNLEYMERFKETAPLTYTYFARMMDQCD